MSNRKDEALATWGELREGLHIAGYSFERACRRLEEMLEGSTWKIAGRFKDVNAFLESLRFDNLRASADARKRIAVRIKELQPKAKTEAIAKMLKVSKRTIERARNATNVASGKEKPKNNKGRNATNVASGKEAAETVRRAERVKETQANTAARVAKVSLDAKALGKFSVLLADPPWDDEFGANQRSIENHYPTMKFEDILALQVADIAHEQAMLFLWATSSMLEMALETVRAWGFTYRTCMVWVKPSIGIGKYVRQRHELLLICRRGEHPAPAPENLPDSVVEAARGEHSVKPEVFHQIIERMYPTAEKIELFRRGQPRDGWKAWGAEVEVTKEAAE
jgi:N6-adenosine-specific RNA methylase IME4